MNISYAKRIPVVLAYLGMVLLRFGRQRWHRPVRRVLRRTRRCGSASRARCTTIGTSTTNRSAYRSTMALSCCTDSSRASGIYEMRYASPARLR